MDRYGRSAEEWARLIDVGSGFLMERGRLRRTTSYTEFNAALVKRTGVRGFDFDRESDRAAVGELLGHISDTMIDRTGGLLLSALVQYLDANDAGPGFYTLARRKGLDVPARADDRMLFWAGHVKAIHDRCAH